MPTTSQINWAKFRVSSLTVLGLVILFVLFYLLTGGTLLQKKATIYLYVPDSTGIGSGSPVEVDGVEVGKVTRVALSGDTRPDRIVRVTITVERSWLASIPVDSYAQLSAETLIGDRFVDITSGTSRTPIRPNGEILYKEKPDVLKRLDLQEFQKRLRTIDAEIGDIEQGRGPVGQLLRTSGMYDEWRKLLQKSQKAVDAVAARDGLLGRAVYTDRQYQALLESVRSIDQTLARLQSGQGDLGRFLRDDARYQQLTASVVDLRRSIAAVDAGPMFQTAADYTQWSRGVSGVIRAIDDFNISPLMETAQVYETLNGMTRELQNNMRDFREHPQKFLRLKVF